MFALAVEENCRRLAQLVEEALIAEVTLSPKPGLVDAIDSGAHHDMDQALFLRSARALTPYFEEMALVSWGKQHVSRVAGSNRCHRSEGRTGDVGSHWWHQHS